jgi:predicted transcriptional regulator
LDYILSHLERSNRSIHEMISDILRSISAGGVTFNEIQIRTHISYRHLKKYVTYLVQNEAIVYRKEEKRFRISQRGVRVLDTYTKIDELLIRKTMHEMEKTPENAVPFP